MDYRSGYNSTADALQGIDVLRPIILGFDELRALSIHRSLVDFQIFKRQSGAARHFAGAGRRGR
ncbi:Uncharacterised protein [Klebsiella pneumoniae subsp. rhinoscleromatis]|nr:Uncharacterised protein [Klebsiella pneumoniae subsp. rhinoscleromatis]